MDTKQKGKSQYVRGWEVLTESNSMGNGERKCMVLGRALAVLYRGVREGLSHRKLRESKRASHVGRGSAKDLKRKHAWRG